jgi:hypothetical protein
MSYRRPMSAKSCGARYATRNSRKKRVPERKHASNGMTAFDSADPGSGEG